MKKIIIIMAVALAPCAKAQKVKEAEVPKAVKESQQKIFPGSKVTKWEKEGNNYEAEFMVKKTETSAEFDANGALLQTETEMDVKELPKSVTDYVSTNLPGKKIKEASKIILATGEINYEAEVDGTDYIFDSNGKLLKKESDNDKDDDDKK